ncbi:DUF2238 domain-containing protein [Fictibacillus sp. 26RED30]|uniref:DUF2238 domain-containing protein n=1 Tax=Fictibacillus sp. 26RED30 TaxID=2745877 RepID=UPI0018CE3034|nr:DUF2238 domain-containing protein [Fictibacillus sp. 26RED30]MBH0160743.1 DUF2238 domain-containing protein [Fictibacillus sp. 26RED30]
MKVNKIHVVLLIIAFFFFLWSLIKPAHYPIWILEVAPSVIAIIFVFFLYKKLRFTSLTYCIIALLSILTFIGGHYTYDDVPFFDWLQQHYDLNRNHYDRFGHFMKGLLAIVIREILLLNTPLRLGKWVQFIAISITLAIAALYEIVEWIAGKIAKRETKDFVGAQGDIWDAQWDMSLTLLGSLLALLLLTSWHNKLIKKEKR